MARLVIEDSEDEFPDIAESVKSRSMASNGKVSTSPVKGRKALTKGPELEDEDEGVAARDKPLFKGTAKKKRILKTRDDNPLLRPIGAKTGIDFPKIEPRKKSKPRMLKQSDNESSLVSVIKAAATESLESAPRSKVEVKRTAKGKVIGIPPEIDGEVGAEEESGVDVDAEIEVDVEEEELIQKPKQNSTKESALMPPPGRIRSESPPPARRTNAECKRVTKRRTPELSTPLGSEYEDENFEQDDDDGLSDFVVDDSDVLEEDDSIMEIKEMPPPRSVRRLVQGRRPQKEDDEKLELVMGKLTFDDDYHMDPFNEQPKKGKKDSKTLDSDADTSFRRQDKAKSSKEAPPKKKILEPSSDLDDPFMLRFSPSENKRKVSKEAHFTTPPASPSKPKGLASPKKIPRIPSTPHRPSTDAFWAPDIINAWNDSYSPVKNLSPPKPSKPPSPIKPDRLAKETKKAFSATKHELAASFLTELDDAITDGQVSRLAESTGGVQIIWSKKLSTTAGRANWKRETLKSLGSQDASGKPVIKYRHHASIELAEKVIDDEDRLLNVIAHEFCHLANFMISNIKTNPHGKEFKAWAQKVSDVFQRRGINVTTTHKYEIEYKYVWECENCGTEFKRHSKSIDTLRHRCGVCKSMLVQTKPVPRVNGHVKGEKTLSGYQMFVKENMGIVRKENPESPQKDLMGLVGKRYKEMKAKTAGEKHVEIVSVEVDEVVGSKETSPENDGVEDVVRKLDFLDLTSP